MAALGDMAANHDAAVTYEGDNNVLVQQTSNWILRQWNDLQSGSTTVSPLATVKFLIQGPTILRRKFKYDSVNTRLTLDCK